jgi:hypothetical protein
MTVTVTAAETETLEFEASLVAAAAPPVVPAV